MTNSLNKNYVYNNNTDFDYKGGITINKKLNINGNGFTINGNNQARTFYINSENVQLNNIFFINCFAEDGGAIFWGYANGKVDDCSLINCSFINCFAEYGGAIFWNHNGGKVVDCSLINCSSFEGGGIYWSGNGRLINSSFVNCFVYNNGGAVYWGGDNGYLLNCSFLNCYLSYDKDKDIPWFPGQGIDGMWIPGQGGAIYWEGINGSVVNSIFVNCSSFDGGGIYWERENGNVINSTFVNCVALNYGGAIFWWIYDGYLWDCSFVNCSSFYKDNNNVYWRGAFSSVKIRNIANVIYGNSINIRFDIENRTDVRIIIVNSKNEEIYNQLTDENYIKINGLGVDNYKVTIYNLANADYMPSSDSKNFSVIKANSLVTISKINDIKYGTESIVNFNVVNRTSVNYILTQNGKELKKGSISSSNINLGVLSSDSYEITVINNENENYTSSKDTKTFNVNGLTPTITVENDTFLIGEKLIIGIPNDATGKINVKLADKNYDGTLNSGKFTITVPNINEGRYKLSVHYYGDNKYAAQDFNKNIDIKEKNNGLNVKIYKLSDEYDGYNHVSSIISSYIGDNAVYITRKYMDGLDYIVLTINENFKGEAYIFDQSTNYEQSRFSIDNEKGKDIYILIDNFKSGDYALIINKSTPSGTQTIAYSLFFMPYTSSAPDVTKYYGGSERFTAIIKNEVGKIVPNAAVTFVINGQTYAKTSDNQGKASLALNLNSGTYNVITEYDNQMVYSKVTIKPTISANDFSKIYKNGTQYYGTFVDSKGNILKNTPVKFNINGVFYTRTTNDKGIAKMNINLNPGTYILTATNPSNGENKATTINVLSSIVENYDLTKYYKNNSQYRVRLLDDAGKPVGAGVDVTFNINGVFYKRSTDENGYAKMNINLGEGTYIITADYKGLKASNTIKVLPILSANDLSMSFRDGSKFAVKLLDGHGRPYAGQTVTMNINGVFYDRVTDNNGVARLNINLQANEYIITSMFNGFSISNIIKIAPNYMYYTIGNNPLDYNYYMNEYNKFSLDWYYNPQWNAMVKTIYDIYGNRGMEIQDQDVRNGIKYHCYDASTGKQYVLNSAGEVLPFY